MVTWRRIGSRPSEITVPVRASAAKEFACTPTPTDSAGSIGQLGAPELGVPGFVAPEQDETGLGAPLHSIHRTWIHPCGPGSGGFGGGPLPIGDINHAPHGSRNDWATGCRLGIPSNRPA